MIFNKNITILLSFHANNLNKKKEEEKKREILRLIGIQSIIESL